MHSADILAAVRKSKYRFFPAVSKKYGVSEARLRAALKRPQSGAEKVIAEVTGIPLHVLWPDRWSANGERLVRRGHPPKRAA